MCGIAGIVGTDAQARADVVGRMNVSQRHRGPDGDGVFTSDGVALGGVRLAIIDSTAAGNQPMSTEDGRYTIVHNGEVFNYIELRQELKDGGRFQSDTDTEVILRAYAKWGPASLDRMVGMFAFAIWDRDERTLFCARDRFGVKPFYYTSHDGCVYFASEIKALLQPGMRRAPHLPAIRDYLASGLYEHDTDTFFEGIQRLAPGHMLVLRPGDVPSPKPYYRLPDHVDPSQRWDDGAATLRLRELLEDAIRLRLRADVKVGVSLSGGLDSSTLLAVVDRMAARPEDIEAFSCIYSDSRYSERPWVELMSRATKRRVTFSMLEPADVWDALEAVTWYQDEPFGGVPAVSWIGMYVASRQRGVKVMLDGHGLDDILGGYRSHHSAYLADCFTGQPSSVFEREFEGYLTGWGVSWEQGLRDLHQACRDDSGVMALDASSPVRPEYLTDALLSLPAPVPVFERPFASRAKNQMYRGLMHTKVPRSVRFLDRASMMFSRELRVPFLDHRLVEFCFSLGDYHYFRDGLSKYVLRQAMADLVPADVRLVPKRSVPAPQREWLQAPLKREIEGLFANASFASRGLIDAPRARAAYQEYCGGNQSNSFYVWQWINLEFWFRTFIDPATLAAPSPAWRDFTVDSLVPV